MSLIPEGFSESEFRELQSADPEFAQVLLNEIKRDQKTSIPRRIQRVPS